VFILPVHRTATWLLLAAVGLVAVSAVAIYARDELGITRVAGVTYLQILRIDREVNNLPSWYSSSLLLIGGLSIAAIGARVPVRGLRMRWCALAALLVVMSIDESVRLHERLDSLVSNIVGLRMPWFVPAGILVMALLTATRDVWRTVSGGDRRRFAQGAAVFAAGSVGVEVIYKLVAPEAESLLHYALVHVEEGVEMCGVALLLRAAWLTMAPDGRLAFSIGHDEPVPSTVRSDSTRR